MFISCIIFFKELYFEYQIIIKNEREYSKVRK